MSRLPLRIVTYNVHRGRGTDRVRDVPRIGEVLRHHAPDIAALQEITYNPAWDQNRSQGRVLAESANLPHGAVGLNCIRREGVYGNATLSRWTIEETENLDLSVRFQIARGALWTKVRLPGDHGVLHVCNVHLGFAGLEQRAQLRRAFAFLEERTGPGEGVVVLGDMNDWRHRLVRAVVLDAGFSPALGDLRDAGPATFPSREPLGSLDKIFVRGPVRVVRASVSRLALTKLASDHLPVVADLEILT